MLNKYVIDKSSLDVLRDRFLLVDTNFIIDASLFQAEAVELVENFAQLGCELVTTKSVVTEFFGGTSNENDWEAKVALLELLFSRSLDEIAGLSVNHFPPKQEFLKYSRQCKKFDIADFELYLTLQKYASAKLLLLTRNHSDFTSKLFKREGFITLLGNKEIRTYGLYSSL